MYRVIYDYTTKEGFLETNSIVYNELRLAFAFIRSLTSRKDVIGKPVLERVQ